MICLPFLVTCIVVFANVASVCAVCVRVCEYISWLLALLVHSSLCMVDGGDVGNEELL